jgi:hypothetical protein
MTATFRAGRAVDLAAGEPAADQRVVPAPGVVRAQPVGRDLRAARRSLIL